MATNKDLLKEAIADAKTVRETAIANAKAALEEAFTPQLQSMLSQKIQEMAEEEEPVNEMEEMDEMEDVHEGEDSDELNELNLDELLAELEESDDEETVTEAEEEEAEEEESEEEEEEGEEDEDLDLEDMTKEDLEDVIKDILGDLGVEFSEEEGEEDMEDMEMGGDEMPMGDEADLEEDVDISSLLEEIDALEEGDEEELDEITLNPYKRFVNKFIKQEGDLAEKAKDDEGAFKQLLTKFQNFMKSEGITGGARNNYLKPFYAALGKKGEGAYKGGKFSAPGSSELSGGQVGEELAEALAKIETLEEALEVKDKALNEVNLLNAKLLYTNRVFRGKDLTESQKVKVLETFDKASSTKEAELIYETMTASMSNKKKSTISESMGSASRPSGTTKTKQVINENDAFARMREIAFYDKKH